MVAWESIQGIVRHILTFGGGYLVSQGYIDEASVVEVVGGAMTLIGLAWSVWQKKKAAE